jgi:hypothetical protein
VRNTGEMFEFVNNIKKISDNINFFISIHSGAGTGIGDIKFSEEYKMLIERADREIVTNIKNSARPQSSSKRKKLIRL